MTDLKEDLQAEGIELDDTILTDMGQLPTTTHQFDRIVGNELRCSLHDTCTVIRIKPTEVLERNQEGELVLVDKA